MRSHSLAVSFVVLMLSAVSLTGCLSGETTKGEPAISRVHTLTFDRASMERAERHEDDPERALRELLDTTIVVRVGSPGDYTLEYTDESGVAQRQTITASPGSPVSIAGADPLAPVVLKNGEEVVSVRAGVNHVWWHAGDMPFGFSLTPGAKAVYDFRSRAEETLRLSNLDVKSEKVHLDSMTFSLKLPTTGSVSWEHTADTGEGAPLLLQGNIGIPAGAGDLLSFEVAASMDGQSGAAGIIAGVREASASGSAKLWVRDGQPIAAQFLGGNVKADPMASVWIEGFFEDLAGDQECSGATRANPCTPNDVKRFEESTPAEDKEVFDPKDYPKVEDDDDRIALTLLQRIFAQDIQVGDKAMLVMRADREDFAQGSPDPIDGDFLMEFTIEAAALEDLTVPAGKFSALKIVEEARTTFRVSNIKDPAGDVVVPNFQMNEIVARTTLWLDAQTYQPVKLVAETPINLDSLLKSMMDSVAPSAWDEIGGKPISNSDWSVVAMAESSYELREHAPGTQLSALVGLVLGHSLAGTLMGGPAGVLMPAATTGFWGGSGFAQPAYPIETCPPPPPDWPDHEPYHCPAYPSHGHEWGSGYERPTYPAASLAISSSGPIADGKKTYTIASASDGLDWTRLGIHINGAQVWMDDSGACGQPMEYMYTACRGGAPVTYDAYVEAGDQLTLRVESGDNIRIVDMWSDSVIMTLTAS